MIADRGRLVAAERRERGRPIVDHAGVLGRRSYLTPRHFHVGRQARLRLNDWLLLFLDSGRPLSRSHIPISDT